MTRLTVDVVLDAAAAAGPPAGAAVIVQVRDTSLQDVAATTLAEGRGIVASAGVLASVDLELEDGPGERTIWAHVDVDGDGRVGPGDLITMESFPVPPGATRAEARVRPVSQASPPPLG
jgi:hypothetical protein